MFKCSLSLCLSLFLSLSLTHVFKFLSPDTCSLKLTSSLSHPQRTCYLHGEQDHDPSRRLHVCGQKEEEAHPKTVKKRCVIFYICSMNAHFLGAFLFGLVALLWRNLKLDYLIVKLL